MLCCSLSVQEPMSTTSLSVLVGIAEGHNKANNITGVLMTDRSTFVHVLEGASDHLDALIVKLSRDRRHKAFRVIARRAVSERQYNEWSLMLDLTHTTDVQWIASVVNIGDGDERTSWHGSNSSAEVA
ncbi:BLUF domain-containing protein [Brevundimonas nasdae]|uniref:BLUF domain-containing protein n=1 Tax=Brevundimonas nasdae TaxID=172043 RepID=UPI003977AB0E